MLIDQERAVEIAGRITASNAEYTLTQTNAALGAEKRPEPTQPRIQSFTELFKQFAETLSGGSDAEKRQVLDHMETIAFFIDGSISDGVDALDWIYMVTNGVLSMFDDEDEWEKAMEELQDAC